VLAVLDAGGDGVAVAAVANLWIARIVAAGFSSRSQAGS
jgi:fructose-1-phosphate kinase PfkB-like protein